MFVVVGVLCVCVCVCVRVCVCVCVRVCCCVLYGHIFLSDVIVFWPLGLVSKVLITGADGNI